MRHHESFGSGNPDYGFNNGLDVNVIRHERDGGRRIDELAWSRQELLDLPNAGQDPERDRKVAEQLEKTYVTRVLGGVAIEAAVAGNENSEDIHLIYYGWGGSSRNPVAINEAQAIVANNPNSQFVFTNAPGVGKSSFLTPGMEAEMRRGNYAVYGKLAAEAVEDMTDGKRVHVGGHSLGARTAIAATPYVNDGKGVETMIINDPPGSEKLHLGKLGVRFIGQEGLRLRRYVKAGFDPRIPDLQKSLMVAVDSGNDEKVKGGLRHQFLVEPFALGKQTLERELHESVRYVNGEVRVLLPELSALNSWEAIADIVGRVRSMSDTKATLESWIMVDHTHSWMSAAPSVEAMLYNERQAQSPFAE